jgi:hypothetical protein
MENHGKPAIALFVFDCMDIHQQVAVAETGDSLLRHPVV